MIKLPHLLIALGWNIRPLTFEDFERAGDQLGIKIQYAPIRTPGMHFICRGVPIITLSTRIRGVRLWLAAWHELAHHLLHAPGLRCYSPGYVSKAEAEAELIALCAVIDENTLFRILAFGELHDFPRDVLRKRIKLCERYPHLAILTDN